jgi:hypothetical protein
LVLGQPVFSDFDLPGLGTIDDRVRLTRWSIFFNFLKISLDDSADIAEAGFRQSLGALQVPDERFTLTIEHVRSLHRSGMETNRTLPSSVICSVKAGTGSSTLTN